LVVVLNVAEVLWSAPANPLALELGDGIERRSVSYFDATSRLV